MGEVLNSLPTRHRMGTRVRILSEYGAYDGITGTIVDSRSEPFAGVTYCVQFDPGQVDAEGAPVQESLGDRYWIYEENLEAVQP